VKKCKSPEVKSPDEQLCKSAKGGSPEGKSAEAQKCKKDSRGRGGKAYFLVFSRGIALKQEGRSEAFLF
jgi:hypothetical protein